MVPDPSTSEDEPRAGAGAGPRAPGAGATTPPRSQPRWRRFARRTGRGARRTVRGIGTAARATGRASRLTAAGAGRFSRFTVHHAKRASEAEGAGESGLSRLIQMHFFNTAGDTAVAIALAGTLFFQVPTGEARSQVALFLGLTMLPFAIVAPLIGPFLDRFAHGRRWAIGFTMAIRAFLCWALATAVTQDSPWLFAGALGVLVSSKAYGVTRAAAVPRLRPGHLSLVKSNGRVSLAGMAGAAVAAPLAGAAAYLGGEWALRVAFLLFALATIAAIRLPEKVDSSLGEGTLVLHGSAGDGRPGRRLRTRIPGPVAFALRANCSPRFHAGFLLMFMAFLLRESPPTDALRPEVLIGLVAVAAGVGNGIGVVSAALLRRIDPRVAVVAAMLANIVALLLAVLFYGLVTIAVLGLVAGAAQSLAKFCLDSTIQHEIPHRVQASAFARSDTTLQLAWVVGGFVGIALPLEPSWVGLAVGSVVLTAWAVYVLATAPGARPVRVSDVRGS